MATEVIYTDRQQRVWRQIACSDGSGGWAFMANYFRDSPGGNGVPECSDIAETGLLVYAAVLVAARDGLQRDPNYGLTRYSSEAIAGSRRSLTQYRLNALCTWVIHDAGAQSFAQSRQALLAQARQSDLTPSLQEQGRVVAEMIAANSSGCRMRGVTGAAFAGMTAMYATTFLQSAPMLTAVAFEAPYEPFTETLSYPNTMFVTSGTLPETWRIRAQEFFVRPSSSAAGFNGLYGSLRTLARLD
jgi:hypothetical protein